MFSLKSEKKVIDHEREKMPKPGYLSAFYLNLRERTNFREESLYTSFSHKKNNVGEILMQKANFPLTERARK